MKNSLVVCKNDNFEVSKYSFSFGEAYYASFRYPNHPMNQDSMGIYELEGGHVVLLVSDGMGGHAGGEIASKLICDTFKKVLKNKKGNARNHVLDAIEKSNRAIQKLKIGAGATLTCCLIDKSGKSVRFFNIGDSSQLLLGSRGKLKYRGIEHSPLGHGIEAGIIEDRTEQDIVESNIVSNGVGFPNMRIEMSEPIEVSEGDLILLASDGIIDSRNRNDLISWAVGGEFSERVGKLVKEFEGKEDAIFDDSTLILFKRA